MIHTTAVLGTAREIIEYPQANGNGSKYFLTQESPSSLSDVSLDQQRLTLEDEEALLDEAGRIGEGRTDPMLRYDREDIYFDR